MEQYSHLGNDTNNIPFYLMDKLQELLTITMEECGELIQVCSKGIRK